MDRRKSKAKFFGFPLSKSGAQIVYILGVLMLIGTSLGSIWLIYIVWGSYTAWQYYIGLGLEGYYAWSVFSWIPYIVVIISFLILAIYMMQCGKRGR